MLNRLRDKCRARIKETRSAHSTWFSLHFEIERSSSLLRNSLANSLVLFVCNLLVYLFVDNQKSLVIHGVPTFAFGTGFSLILSFRFYCESILKIGNFSYPVKINCIVNENPLVRLDMLSIMLKTSIYF